MSDERTLGQVAYDAWWAIRKPDDYEVAAWRELDPAIREAWRAAAVAVAYRSDELKREMPQRYDGSTGSRSRPFEPPIDTRAGDVMLFAATGNEVFVQRDGEHVAHYVDDGSGVLRLRPMAS